MPTPESDILKPIEPSQDEDQWTEFILSNASVVHESNGKPANLLLAYADTPLRITGRLETPRRDQSQYRMSMHEADMKLFSDKITVLKKPYKSTEIVLRNVTRFSYGEITDGTHVIWALGEAGWFEIQPAANYKAMHNDMLQAVQLLYFVTDIYNEPRKRGGGPSASLIYQEVSERRLRKMAPQAFDPPKKDDNWWEAAALFEFMQKAVNRRIIRAGRNSITVERVAQLIIRRYEIESVETARNVLLVHAQNLCYMMDHPRRQNVRFFAAEPIYGELTAGHSMSAAEQRRAEGVELRLRKERGSLRDEDSESSDTSDEEDDIVSTPVRQMSGRSKKGTLSVLRPRSGKFSGKGKTVQRGGKGKTKPPMPVSESDSSPANDEDDAMEIDTPTHALSPEPSKRKLDTSDEAGERSRRKRALSSSIAPSSPPISSDSSPQPGTADPPLPLRYHAADGHGSKSSTSTRPVLPAIVSTPLPTYEPNGPRDSWICSFDGCAQRIYGCSKKIGRQLITEHLEDHTKGREKVVGILWREQDKLQLPVK
ncbi:hypothetical protein N0V94_003583 [Neodidymelliopsis sp. IMI 364377]|nr:hypothetical protein N0V94_003583 [Neodidymelliopsis sp. IMI 364377]